MFDVRCIFIVGFDFFVVVVVAFAVAVCVYNAAVVILLRVLFHHVTTVFFILTFVVFLFSNGAGSGTSAGGDVITCKIFVISYCHHIAEPFIVILIASAVFF